MADGASVDVRHTTTANGRTQERTTLVGPVLPYRVRAAMAYGAIGAVLGHMDYAPLGRWTVPPMFP